MLDVIIVGGGMVGAAAGLGLAQLGYQVGMVETYMPQPFNRDDAPDMRVSAISAGSVALLEKLGAWSNIQSMRLCPLKHLSVWEQAASQTTFSASDNGLTYLAYIVENRLVQLGLHQALTDISNTDVGNDGTGKITWFNQPISSLLESEGSVSICFETGEMLETSLLIGADGVNSNVRQWANIGTTGWQYKQQALAILVDMPNAEKDMTWQQFTPTGPVAYLPMFGNYASLVWYHQQDQVRRLKRLSEPDLTNEIRQAFPTCLGDFKVLSTASFPLQRMHAQRYFNGRVALVGDSAHAINPLAGQGVNLGFKDVKCLLALLEDKPDLADRAHLLKLLNKYQATRYPDNLLMMSSMDLLYKGFSNNILPLKALRNLGLQLADKSGLLKSEAMKYAMGL